MRNKASAARHFSSAVIPAQPPAHATHGHSNTHKSRETRQNTRVPSVLVSVVKLRKPETTFLQAFGALGVPLLLVICVSIAWTTWLIVLNAAPNATANYLMDTTEFDDGSFWLIIDPDPVFLLLVCLGLCTVLLGYLYAFAAMTVLRTRGFETTASESFVSTITRKVLSESVVTTWSTLTGFQGRYRKLWVRPRPDYRLCDDPCGSISTHTTSCCCITRICGSRRSTWRSRSSR